MTFLLTYLGTGLAFAGLDAVYLTTIGGKLYRPLLDPVLADQPNLPAAIVFYLIYILGIVLLAVLPNRQASVGRTAVTGAILGVMTYATYDLTNQATLKVWATHLTLIDMTWGAVVTLVGATAGAITWRWASRMFGG